MENRDEWLAIDKLEHILFCFTISIFISTLLNQSRYSFLRKHSISIGSLISIAAGAAKEIGDEIGLWNSAGASFKDAIADLLGTLMAAILLRILRNFSTVSDETKAIRGIQLV
ncbi:hypothetical protein ACHQM5_029857 [Ranunculus cassubicifolius]